MTFVWADQNVLCSGSACDKYRRAVLKAAVHIYDSYGSLSNGRRDPLDWRIVGPPKYYSPGQGGSGGPSAFTEPGP